jgi:hypothetical protein
MTGSAYYLLMPSQRFATAKPESEGDADALRSLWHALGRSERIADPPMLCWVSEPEDVADWKWGLPYVCLLSTAFREIIDAHLRPADELQWVAAKLKVGSMEEDRWIPHFPGPRDVLDADRTDWGPSGLPVRWVLSETKLKDVAVTSLPHESGDFIVSADIMRALRRAKLTGYTVMRARFE